MSSPATKDRYPRRSTVERMIAAARAADIKVGGFEVDPDGTIRILKEGATAGTDAYERWQARRAKA